MPIMVTASSMEGSWIETIIIIHSGLVAELSEEGSAQAFDAFTPALRSCIGSFGFGPGVVILCAKGAP